MKLRVLAFATAAEAIGADEIEIELPDGSGLPDLADRLQRDYPDLGAIWPRLAVAVDGELVPPETRLTDTAEVALLPPVSGGQRSVRVRLTEGPLDLEQIVSEIAKPASGAVVVFVGTVRDNHEGQSVAKLTYDAYRPMAEQTLQKIARELEEDDKGLRIAIVHRLGEVPVGEASVVIAVASPHRAAAYNASRQALERLKREVPIWKREHYTEGGSRWREEESLGTSDARAPRAFPRAVN